MQPDPYDQYDLPAPPPQYRPGPPPPPQPMPPPPRPSSVNPLLLAGLVVTGVLLLTALALLGRAQEQAKHASSSAPTAAPSTASAPTAVLAAPHRLDATGVVTVLAGHHLVDAAKCPSESGIQPATSQRRCHLDHGKELVIMGFADAAGVRNRMENWLGDGALVQGPNWLVNVEDVAAGKREQVRAALDGTLVKIPG